MTTSLEWKTVGKIQVGDKLAQIVSARHGEKLANVERRTGGRRAIVTATSTNYKGDVTLTMTIGRARITRQWLSDAVLASEVISTSETDLVNMPNLASVLPAAQTNTDQEVTVNPIQRAADNADKINAANAELERQSHEKFVAEHLIIVHVTDNNQTAGRHKGSTNFGQCAAHRGTHNFRNDPHPCIDWTDDNNDQEA